jgi:hypothetical protein
MTLSHCHPDATHKPGDCLVCDYYQAQLHAKRTFAHCDAYVVHAPTQCTYCDEYLADIQKWRADNGVNFTGENDADKLPCPATVRRDVQKIHRWYGNAPQPKACKVCGAKAVFVNLALGCPEHGPI